MNFIKSTTVLPCPKGFLQFFFMTLGISLFLGSCGGGSVPEYLENAKVEVSVWSPNKELILKNESLNLVKAIVPIRNTSEFLIIGNAQAVALSSDKSFSNSFSLDPELYQISIVNNRSGQPSYLVGSALWGKPSAAVFDLKGDLKWKVDYEYDAMGNVAVVDSPNARFVVLEHNEEGLLYLNFESGEIERKESSKRIIGSADFTGDGNYELLVGLGENDFTLLDGNEKIIAQVTLDDSYWYEPAIIQSDSALVVLSAGNVLDVYDAKLNFLKTYDAKGALSPMHVEAATFLSNGPSEAFAEKYIS